MTDPDSIRAWWLAEILRKPHCHALFEMLREIERHGVIPDRFEIDALVKAGNEVLEALEYGADKAENDCRLGRASCDRLDRMKEDVEDYRDEIRDLEVKIADLKRGVEFKRLEEERDNYRELYEAEGAVNRRIHAERSKLQSIAEEAEDRRNEEWQKRLAAESKLEELLDRYEKPRQQEFEIIQVLLDED